MQRVDYTYVKWVGLDEGAQALYGGPCRPWLQGCSDVLQYLNNTPH
jgi:hypothetical protein